MAMDNLCCSFPPNQKADSKITVREVEPRFADEHDHDVAREKAEKTLYQVFKPYADNIID